MNPRILKKQCKRAREFFRRSGTLIRMEEIVYEPDTEMYNVPFNVHGSRTFLNYFDRKASVVKLLHGTPGYAWCTDSMDGQEWDDNLAYVILLDMIQHESVPEDWDWDSNSWPPIIRLRNPTEVFALAERLLKEGKL